MHGERKMLPAGVPTRKGRKDNMPKGTHLTTIIAEPKGGKGKTTRSESFTSKKGPYKGGGVRGKRGKKNEASAVGKKTRW